MSASESPSSNKLEYVESSPGTEKSFPRTAQDCQARLSTPEGCAGAQEQGLRDGERVVTQSDGRLALDAGRKDDDGKHAHTQKQQAQSSLQFRHTHSVSSTPRASQRIRNHTAQPHVFGIQCMKTMPTQFHEPAGPARARDVLAAIFVSALPLHPHPLGADRH